MAVKVGFLDLSSCFGCHQSLLNANQDLIPVIKELEFYFLPLPSGSINKSVLDADDGEITYGFITGVVRKKEDNEKISLMRKKCKTIITLGACACYGGIKGLSNLYGISELTDNPNEFENFLTNIKDLIDVDIFIPGCPPTTENILATLYYLLTKIGDSLVKIDKSRTMCDNCNLYTEGCFLDEGNLCFGSITAGGCNLKCPNDGDICYGCFQATDKPGEKTAKLREILGENSTLSSYDGKILQHYLDLYLGTANLTNFYYRGDFLQKLAYEPGKYETSKIDGSSLLNVDLTGITIIDEIIGRILLLLKDDPSFKFSTKSVCSHCEREIVDKIPTTLKRDYEGLSTTDKCFLEQGYICLGPATHAGCGTRCPNKANSPCLGCYGNPAGVKDQGAQFINTLGSLTFEMDPIEVANFIKDPAGLFNRFSLANSTLKHFINDNLEEGNE
jgi:F420-non-reducing hydrogenase small subunit